MEYFGPCGTLTEFTGFQFFIKRDGQFFCKVKALGILMKLFNWLPLLYARELIEEGKEVSFHFYMTDRQKRAAAWSGAVIDLLSKTY